MNTPIFDFVSKYNAQKSTRFHMPGHKGVRFLGCEDIDITEINGADVLYSPNGIIAESEENATALFSTAHTFYSAEGSSLSIKAMLGLIKSYFGDDLKILAGRNAHKAFIYACALLDIEPYWMHDKNSNNFCSCILTHEDVEKYLKQTHANAVYITSPDYLGNVSDIKAIAQVCDKYGALLLVDNAHGAYLKFLKEDMHPISLGAHLCCDSAHKTLPVLTGGGYLHISKKADAYFCDHARSMLSLFASTSPSYLILQSLDLCNKYIADGFAELLDKSVRTTLDIKRKLNDLGFTICKSEPLKIVIDANKFGYGGSDIADILSQNGVECEFADNQYIVLMISPQNTEQDFAKLLEVLQKIKRLNPIEQKISVAFKVERVLSIRNAVFSNKETVEVCDSLGRVCASPMISCPPAIPIVISGEKITAQAIKAFVDYGIEKIEVVK